MAVAAHSASTASAAPWIVYGCPTGLSEAPKPGMSRVSSRSSPASEAATAAMSSEADG